MAGYGSTSGNNSSSSIVNGRPSSFSSTSSATIINNNNNNTHPQDILVPSFESLQRKSPVVVACFNLIASIVGGAVFSLPLAFERCGIVGATILMLFAAMITDRSLQMLCISARQTGATSYGEVARAAFGEGMEKAVSLLLFIFLMFVLCAYFVLLMDIWTPLVAMAAMGHGGGEEGGAPSVSAEVVLLCILIILSPALVQHTLHALRFNCYVSFASVSFLCFALCYYGWTGPSSSSSSHKKEEEEEDVTIRYAIIPNWNDAFFAFSITMLSFLSQFNIVPIQGALIYPTRKRMEFVITMSIVACLVIMYLFGLGGYLYAGTKTQGNILLNVISDDAKYEWPFLVGRIGCGITIMMASPVMLLPCRESILELIDDCWFQTPDDVSEIHHHEGGGEATTLLRHEPIQQDPLFRNPVVHYTSTFLIVFTCYMGAVAVTGVAVIWSLIGSSMAFLVGFIIPAACFIKIEQQQQQSSTTHHDGPRPHYWLRFAWALLIFSSIAAIVCTYNTVSRW